MNSNMCQRTAPNASDSEYLPLYHFQLAEVFYRFTAQLTDYAP